MKKTTVIIILIIALIIIIVDIFLWSMYQRNIKAPILNTNLNQSNLNLPVLTNSPAIITSNENQNSNINTAVTNENQNQNQNLNTNISPNITNTPVDQTRQEIISAIQTDLANTYFIPKITDDLAEYAKTNESAVPALIDLTNNQDLKIRYIALDTLYKIEILKDTADPEVLLAYRKILQDKDPKMNFIGAMFLARLGQKDAIPVLISGLQNNTSAYFSEPISTVHEVAAQYLQAVTNKNLGYDYNIWLAWWQKNQPTLTWNQEKKIFE